YEQDYTAFYPYSSKYDAYLAGQAALTPQEARGLALFDDPAKGNCAHCHPSARGADGTPPQFTDYGFVALGVPRNRAIPANADPKFYDLGLCGPLRTDLRAHSDYCGLFKTPSLRNVATRKSFFHNGVFHSLRRAIEFYAERDTDPGKFYPRDASGRIEKFDDLPPAYRVNVNIEPPFGEHPGEAPPLVAAEISDIAAFLGTLSRGAQASPRACASSIVTTMRPIGQSEIGTSFRCAQAKGMPMMVTARPTAKMRWAMASHHPARMSQMMLPRTPKGPVPKSSWPVKRARDTVVLPKGSKV